MADSVEPILGAGVLFLAPLLTASIVVGTSYGRREASAVPAADTEWHKPLGPSSWDFTKSWASNLTILGAVLGTILAQFTWSDSPSSDSRKAFYTAACLFWGLVITLAPASYNLIRDVEAPSRENAGRTTFHGYVGGFLLASLFTTYGALGEFGTLVALTYEMRATGFIPGSAALGFALLLLSLFFGICFYVFRNVQLTLRYQVLAAAYRNKLTEAAREKAVRLRNVRRAHTATAPLRMPMAPEGDAPAKGGGSADDDDLEALLVGDLVPPPSTWSLL